MGSEELNDLINCIAIEVGNDVNSGISITKVKLTEAQMAPDIIEVLKEKFEHYQSVELHDGRLVLVHPKP